jgi:hypothetical protein
VPGIGELMLASFAPSALSDPKSWYTFYFFPLFFYSFFIHRRGEGERGERRERGGERERAIEML